MAQFDKQKAIAGLGSYILQNRFREYDALRNRIASQANPDNVDVLSDTLRELEDRIMQQLSDLSKSDAQHNLFNENPYISAKREWLRQKLRSDAVEKAREMRLTELIPKKYRK